MLDKKIMNKIKDKLKASNFSGVISISHDGEKNYEQAYGYRDRANLISNNINTKFGIASGTKLFTALGIMRLVEEDKVTLTDRAFDYVDYNFPTYDKQVTIKHLLTHTSGIPDYYDEELVEDFDNFNVSVPWNELLRPSDYLQVLPQRPMKFSPGTSFAYNNSAFILLAVIIEKITGDYHQWIHNEIFIDQRADGQLWILHVRSVA